MILNKNWKPISTIVILVNFSIIFYVFMQAKFTHKTKADVLIASFDLPTAYT